MAERGVQRKLAAILAADVVGYSRLMEADEAGTLEAMKAHRRELWTPLTEQHGGRVVGMAGDSLLVEFASAVASIECAMAVQRGMAERNAQLPERKRMPLRIGINIGEVIVDGDDIFGDGVNVAARLEGLADPGGVCLSGDVYRQVRGKVDAVFVDLGTQSVKNLTEPIHVYGIDIGSPVPLSATVPEAETTLSRPAVAVLPFENLSGDPEQEYFVDGLTEDIITALSQWRSFPVIARNSTFAYKGTSPDVREAGRKLGARFVLEGSVRKGGNRIRVTAQLIDARTGHHVWAERYDRDLDDIFAVQDELTRGIAAVVVPELERVEHKRLIVLKPRHLDAYDCVLQGLAYLNAVNEPDNVRAEEMFRRAVALDPNYGRAYAGLAFALYRVAMFGYSSLTDATVPSALENARRAVQLDGSDYLAHWVVAALYIRTNDHETGLAEAVRSIELNPSNGHGYNLVGLALTLLGRPEEALGHLEKGRALSPNDPRLNLMMNYTALAYYLSRDYAAAADWARRATQLQPDYAESHLFLAAGLGQLDRPREARASLDACERIDPGCLERWASWWRFKHAKDKEHFLDGLRKAGLSG